MESVRVEAELDVALSAENSCSVLWLVPEAGSRELGAVMTAISSLSAMTAWGFVAMWEHSTLLAERKAEISRASHVQAEYRIGATRIDGAMIELSKVEGNWFWDQFAAKIRPHQICGVLVPSSASDEAGWRYAGLQLVLSAAARQLRPGPSHSYTLRSLEQAFLAEAVVAGGIAVTRLRAELLEPGVALTSTKSLADRVSRELPGMRALDSVLVERSRFLSGNW
jgi:hypothetical protein